MATSAEVIEAQRQRYFEYGIPLRDDGHVTKPEAFADTPLDAFGDPVNYLFPMVTQEQTEESQRAFVQDLASGLYPVGSDVIANRLQARLHNADESTNSTDVVIPTNDESSKDSSQVQSVESKRPLSNAAFEAGEILTQAAAAAAGLTELVSKHPVEIKLLTQAEAGLLPPGVIGRVQAELTYGDVTNSEDQIYSTELWQEQMPRLRAMAQANRLLGNLDHPEDGMSRLQGGAIKWLPQSLMLQGNTLSAEGVIMETPWGQAVKAYLQNGVPIESSSRGFGDLYQDGTSHTYVDKSTYVCNGFDAVFFGASADGNRRPRIKSVAQSGQQPTEEGLNMDPKDLVARFKALQEAGFDVASYLEQTGKIGEMEQAVAEGEMAKLESAASALEDVGISKAAAPAPVAQAAAPATAPAPLAQVHVEANADPRARGGYILVPTDYQVPAGLEGGLPGEVAPEPNKANPKIGYETLDVVADVDPSSDQAIARMSGYRQDEKPKELTEFEMEALEQVKARLISEAEGEPVLQKRLEKRLDTTQLKTIGELKQTAKTLRADHEEYREMTAATTPAMQAGSMGHYGTVNFNTNEHDPNDEPPRTLEQAIDEIVERRAHMYVNPGEIIKSLGQEATEFKDGANLHAPPGFRSPKDATREWLRQHCLYNTQHGRAPMLQAGLRQYMALRQALHQRSKSAVEGVLNAPEFALMQAPGDTSTITTNLATTPAMQLEVMASLLPRLLLPLIASTQPTGRKTATVFYEKWYGTSSGGQLVGQMGSGSTPLLPFDNPYYLLAPTYWYAQDPGEMQTVSKIQYKIESTDITVDAFKLATDWSYEVQQDLMAAFNIDIVAKHADRLAKEIARERNDQSLDALLAGVPAAHAYTFAANPPVAFAADGAFQLQWGKEKIYEAMNIARGYVSKDTDRTPNIIIAAQNVVQRMTRANQVGTSQGTFQRELMEGVNIYSMPEQTYVLLEYTRWSHDPTKMNQALIMYRGPSWEETPAVYTPYTVELSPVEDDADTMARSMSMMERSKFTIVNDAFLGSLTVANTTATDVDLIGFT